ncbi:MAG: ATP phosphoribosyltransferase regulatory subunit [Oscillospiraceae bacterium]|nr:ATP phosphoribosyltransferase regulatory subunit [Oscillospiraceae bacterium]
MNTMKLPLDVTEKIAFRLRGLYRQYGYTQYRMSKFEEYDLYARNKDFLLSENVITFTDLSGKLMALKPDVTLSIVKNSRDDATTLQKLYYHENVYRVSKNSHGFREIQQVGLECLGNIDDYCILEVLQLAAQSLNSISDDCVLEISHLGLMSALTESLSSDQKADIFRCVGSKNLHELSAVCKDAGVAEEKAELLKALASLGGAPDAVLPKVKAMLSGIVDTKPLELLEQVSAILGDKIRIDFSVVDDIHYYNGIVFKGFIRGVPDAVLSGGQYDKLMRKMKRESSAIGFAVYMDLLERLESDEPDYDVDTVLTYDEGATIAQISAAAKALMDTGVSVAVYRQIPENLRYRQVKTVR